MIDLQKLIGPDSLTGFLENDFGRNWKHFRGEPGRLSGILNEESLLELLECAEIPLHRITLIHSGHQLAPELFGTPGRADRSIRPDIAKIKHHLEQGAALLVTHLEQLNRPLWDATEHLGEIFREAVTVNAYLARPNSRGFDLHIDHHDVLVFQISGQKYWEIRQPSLKHPLILPEHIGEPSSEALWKGSLQPGDILYLPRGFWHQAKTHETSSLHLTFGIQPCTGLHYLAWLRKNLLDSEIFRQDVPRYNPEDIQKYLQGLKRAIEHIEDPRQLKLFLEEHEMRIDAERQQLGAKIYPD